MAGVFEVSDNVFGCIDVAGGALIIELGYDIGDGSEIRSGLTTEPVE